MTRRAMQRVGENWGLPLWASPMTSPLTPFFCVVNVSEANEADRRAVSDAVARSRRTGPWNSWISARRKGADSLLAPVYSPGRSKKKKAIAIMSATAIFVSELPMSATARTCCRMGTGIGLTRFGGGSCFLYRASWRCRRKSILP
jgi:hypothetical protein